MKTIKNTNALLFLLTALCFCSCGIRPGKTEVLTFKTVEYADSTISENEMESWRVSLRLDLPDSGDAALVRALRSVILFNALGEHSVERYDSHILRAYSDSLVSRNFAQYAVDESFDMEIQPIGFETEIDGSVRLLSLEDSLLSYSTRIRHEQWGSCGDNSFERTRIYQLRYCSPMFLSDIIAGDFSRLLSPLVRKHAEEAGLQCRTDSLLYIDDTQNLALDSTSVTIVFNPYTIACGADGIVRIRLPFEEIKPLMDTATAVYRHLSRHEADK